MVHVIHFSPSNSCGYYIVDMHQLIDSCSALRGSGGTHTQLVVQLENKQSCPYPWRQNINIWCLPQHIQCSSCTTRASPSHSSPNIHTPQPSPARLKLILILRHCRVKIELILHETDICFLYVYIHQNTFFHYSHREWYNWDGVLQ